MPCYIDDDKKTKPRLLARSCSDLGHERKFDNGQRVEKFLIKSIKACDCTQLLSSK